MIANFVTELNKRLEILGQMRDELRLRVHWELSTLGDRWVLLERRWKDVQATAGDARSSGQPMAERAHRRIDELQDAYRHLESLVNQSSRGTD